MRTVIGKSPLMIVGAVIVVFAVGLVVGLTVAAEAEPTQEALLQELVRQAEADPQKGPWPYRKLDIEEVMILAHEGMWGEGEIGTRCAYGAFNAIVAPLQEKLGYPYNQIPTYMLTFGRGGIVGEGSVCGAVNGALVAINLIAGDEYRPLANDLVEWYKNAKLPTDRSNELAQQAMFAAAYTSDMQVQTVARSVNCATSVGNWTAVTGYKMYDSERVERCARLTADVAAAAAIILNDWADGPYVGIEIPKHIDPMKELAAIFADAQLEEIAPATYAAVVDGKIVGYGGIGEADGYNDIISIAIGIDLDGAIRGVRVVEHSETEDLAGDFTGEEWLAQFVGLTIPEDIRLAKDDGRIDAISGATVTSEVAAQIVRDELERLIEKF